MKTTCGQFQETLLSDDWREGNLPPPDHEAASAHLAACRECAREEREMGVLLDLLYAFMVADPSPPWAILPVAVTAFGISCTFPAMTLLMLDRHPRQRGAASSLQAVIWSALNATVAGLVAPAIAAEPRWLAIAAAIFVAAGVGCWWLYRSRFHREPETRASSEEVTAVDPVAETM